LLLAFERAENQKETAEKVRLTTTVIIGGGATGVELAGAIADLSRTVLNRDFRHIDPAQSRIILIDSGPRLLAHLCPTLSASAQKQLEKLGVQVRCSTSVKNIGAEEVELTSGEIIRAGSIIWAAGVSASPINKKLGAPLDKGGRVKVNPDLSVPGHPNVFVIGDAAAVMDAAGRPVPGVAPAAMQMGKYVAEMIKGEIRAGSPSASRPPFQYRDKGNLATIGRSAAVAQIGKVEFSGFTAWLAWLFTHLIFLVGFRNRVSVLSQWIYSYLFYKRSSRIITAPAPEKIIAGR
jgi:NADH dehydrogenase